MEISAVKATQSPQPKRVEPAAKAEPPKEAQAKAKEPSRPNPVVNSQGQTTGRIVNTTA